MTTSDHLITTQELSDAINSGSSEEIAILDCSWYLPTQQRNARAEFESNHIPRASFFDIDAISDKGSDLPHMLPTAESFSESVGHLGIDNNSLVVAYDGAGLFSAARVWWMFHVFGHKNVRVLNGGFPKWLAEKRSVDHSVQPPTTRRFVANKVNDLVVSMPKVLENCSSQQALVLDARSSARFEGTAPEPRPELSSGHVPGAISLPFDQLQSDGLLKPAKELLAVFDELGVTGNDPIITTCGSGVTAAIITLALAEAGLGLHQLYDGAWSEWAAADNTPIIKV
ncbi:MAG TPA: 3-mercaptopyruvate sulfurtransferase [Gammaproteobacteria bacterium]|jgi:thiosulfate/3-mercaptopyruvate sulfurtransferase|nr:3-mercaptopyruvate sulfurtransferase [Gammaproteobacteria bacterium]